MRSAKHFLRSANYFARLAHHCACSDNHCALSAFHCTFSAFHCKRLAFHCACLAFHCACLAFHCACSVVRCVRLDSHCTCLASLRTRSAEPFLRPVTPSTEVQVQDIGNTSGSVLRWPVAGEGLPVRAMDRPPGSDFRRTYSAITTYFTRAFRLGSLKVSATTKLPEKTWTP
jgi:hypothetical protein